MGALHTDPKHVSPIPSSCLVQGSLVSVQHHGTVNGIMGQAAIYV